jgi:sterol 3beta-glucosyltransferase
MRITILAVGSQGDVRPYSALGKGLKDAGFEVRMATHEAFRAAVQTAGLDFAPIAGNPMEILAGDTGKSWLASMDDPLRFMASIVRLAREILDSLNTDALTACRGADALIYSMPLSLSAQTMGEILRVPAIPAALYPLHPTREFPSIMTPRLPLHGAAANWLSGYLVEQVYWKVFRSQQNHWRRDRMRLAGLPLRPPFKPLAIRGIPMLYGYSPSVIATPRDWSPSCTVCGYWFSEPEPWTPPARLIDFISAGPAPVYVGFGSMLSADPVRMTRTVLEGGRLSGCRAVLATGWGGLRAETLPPGVFAITSAPHDWLFPRMAAAVHHGGAGTTAAALRAGIPSIIMPFFADQYFWAGHLHGLGVSPRPLDQKRMGPEDLARAIRAATVAEAPRRRAAGIAERIRGEDGIAAAVGAVSRYLSKTTRRRIQ